MAFQDNINKQKRIPKESRELKVLEFTNPGSKFVLPSGPKRQVKCPEQYNGGNDNKIYDEEGRFLGSSKDICDCLRTDCPGCFYPCPQCRSTRCGPKCRCNRVWCFQIAEIEGTSKVYQLEINQNEEN